MRRHVEHGVVDLNLASTIVGRWPKTRHETAAGHRLAPLATHAVSWPKRNPGTNVDKEMSHLSGHHAAIDANT